MSNPRHHVRFFALPLAIVTCTIFIHRSVTFYLKLFKKGASKEEPMKTSRRKKTTTPGGGSTSIDSSYLLKSVEKNVEPSTAAVSCVEEFDNIIAIINPRSGGQEGLRVIKKLREMGVQVFNMFEFYGNQAIETRERFRNLISIKQGFTRLWKVKQRRDVLILCGGGDGSITSITELVEQASTGLKGVQPTFCPLPLGTGNDLCRSLGWGHRNPSSKKLKRKLTEISHQFLSKNVVFIDKWRLQIKPKHMMEAVLPSGRTPPDSMFCYASFGYDAGIAQKWETSRQEKPEKFTSQAVNNLRYVVYGFQEYFWPSMSNNISEFIKVEIDNNPVQLPAEAKSLKIININSAASGVNFWGTGPSGIQQRPDDGLLEVCATTGVSHLLAIHCGVGQASRCGQGRVIKIEVLKPIPIQVDGEPWTQPPCEVVISMDKTIRFLNGPENKTKKTCSSKFNLGGNPFKRQKGVSRRYKQLKA